MRDLMTSDRLKEIVNQLKALTIPEFFTDATEPLFVTLRSELWRLLDETSGIARNDLELECGVRELLHGICRGIFTQCYGDADGLVFAFSRKYHLIDGVSKSMHAMRASLTDKIVVLCDQLLRVSELI